MLMEDESLAVMSSTAMASLSAKVTPVPATVGVIELPALNSKSFVPRVSVEALDSESEMPIDVTIDAVAVST